MKEKLAGIKDNLVHYGIVAACCGLFAATAGAGNCVSIFQNSLADSIGSGIGGIATVNMFCSFVGTFITSRMPKILSSYKLGAVILFGSLLNAAGYSMQAMCRSIWMLGFCYFIKAVGSTLMGSILTNTVITAWFAKDTGKARGITMCTSGAVGALLTPVFAAIMEKSGWQFSMVLVGIMAFVCCLPAMFFVTLTPEEKGLRPYGWTEEMEQETLHPEEKHADAAAEKTDPPVRPQVWFIAAYAVILSTLVSMGTHVSVYGNSLNVGVSFSALMVSATMLGNLSFKLLVGILCDRFGSRKALPALIALLTGSFVVFLLRPVPDFVMLIACFFTGSAYGLSGLGTAQMAQDSFTREEYGIQYSRILTYSGMVSPFTGLLVGYLYDWTGSFRLFQTIDLVLCAFVYLIIFITFSGRKKKA